MQIFTDTNIDFIGKRKIGYGISGIFVLMGIIGILLGLNFGIDFTGGTLVQVKFFEHVEISDVRDAIAEENCPARSDSRAALI